MNTALIIAAVIFCIAAALKPFKIWKLSVNIATGSILAFIVLYLLQVINTPIVKAGFIGGSQLQPWQIIVIFFSVAYISISLDVTGVFDFIAYRIVHKTKGSGIKLFFSFYLFASVLTLFTSNDIVILTLTPVIFYLGKHASINVIPLLFAEFFGANTLSMLLYIGNPTNIIIGNALGISFLSFSRFMWLPTLVGGILNIILLYLLFRKKITRRFTPLSNSRFAVRSRLDAFISATLLIIMLVCLMMSRHLRRPVWLITGFFSLIFILTDLLFSIYYSLKHKFIPHGEIYKSKEELFKLYGIPEPHNEFWIAVTRMPWKILPFITVLFIFIAGLAEYGAVDRLSGFLSGISQTLEASILINGVTGFILTNVINNQPMTILMSHVFINEHFQTSQEAFHGAAYAVVIASNLGANFTLTGALAGIMWRKILQSKGLNIRYRDFFRTGIIITPLVFFISLLMLYIVIRLSA